MNNKKKKVICVDDLLEAINRLPNASNGYSGSYDKAIIISMVNDIPKHYMTIKNND